MMSFDKRTKFFRGFLHIATIAIVLNSLINLTQIDKELMILLIISILISIAISTMMIDAGSGAVELTDSIAAVLFITLGLNYLVIYTLASALIISFINVKLINKDKEYSKVFFNGSMLVIATYASGIILNYLSPHLPAENVANIVFKSTFFIGLFLVFNLMIFNIDSIVRSNKSLSLSSEARTLIVLNFVVTSILAIIQCIIHESGIIGDILVYITLLIIQYCFSIFRKLQIRNDSIKGLLKITQDIVKYGDFVEKCKNVVVSLKSIIPYTLCSIYLINGKDEKLVFPIAYNSSSQIDIGDLSLDVTGDLINLASSYRDKVYISKNVMNDKRITLNKAVMEEIKALALVPIFINNKIVGLIIIGGTSGLLQLITSGIQDILTILANQMALAIENDRIYGRIKLKAEVDTLTQLYNRRVLNKEMNSLIKAGIEFTLVIYDIDDFKSVNDTYGHPVGDKVLKSISKVIKDSVRASDIPCRYGGEEIAIILKNLKKQDAFVICDRIRKNIEETGTKWNGDDIFVTVSGGVATFPDDGETLHELIDNADKALYSFGKYGGKNKVGVFGNNIN